MTEKRNEFLESDGLLAETETHEWFLDKGNTQWAKSHGVGPSSEELKGIVCCVVRDKKTGYYERVVLENNEPVYSSTKLEDIAVWIDKMKVIKHFNK